MPKHDKQTSLNLDFTGSTPVLSPLNFGLTTQQDTLNYDFTGATAGFGTPKSQRVDITKSPVSASEAFIGGLKFDATFGLADPDYDMEDLSTSAKRAHFAGEMVSFFGSTVALNFATFGVGGVTNIALKGPQIIHKAGKLWKANNAAKAAGKISDKAFRTTQAQILKNAGIGVKPGLNFGTNVGLRSKYLQRVYLEQFMTQAAKGGNAAKRFVIGTEMARESFVWTAVGQKQLFKYDEVTWEKVAKTALQDALAGLTFGYSMIRRFMQPIKQVQKEMSKGLIKRKLGLYEIDSGKLKLGEGAKDRLLQLTAGALASIPNEDGMSANEQWSTRLMMMGFSATFGSLASGYGLQSGAKDVQHAMRTIGVTDESIIGKVTDMGLSLSNKAIKQINNDYSGRTVINNKTKSQAEIKRVYGAKDKKGKEGYYVEYQPRYKPKKGEVQGKKRGELVTKKFDDFFSTHESPDADFLLDVIANSALQGSRDKVHSFGFQTIKEAKNWLNRNNWVLISAEKPKAKVNYKPAGIGEEESFDLIRDLIKRGYKRKDIVAVSRADGGEQSFLIRGMSEKEGVDLAITYGQEAFITNKNYVNIKRSTLNKTKARELTERKKGETVKDWETRVDEERISAGATIKTIQRFENNLDNVLFGANADKALKAKQLNDESASILTFSNGRTMKMHFDIPGLSDMTNPNSFKNVPGKYKIATLNQAMERGINKIDKRQYRGVANDSESILLKRTIKDEEKRLGLDNRTKKDPFNRADTSLKQALFGKKSLREFTKKELQEYVSLLTQKKDPFAKLQFEGGSGVFVEVDRLLGWTNRVINKFIPIVTKYERLALQTGSKTLAKLARQAREYVDIKKQAIGGWLDLQELRKVIFKKNKLSKSEIRELELSLSYYIDGRVSFKALRKKFDDNPRMKTALNELIAEHKKFVKDIAKVAKKAGVMELRYNKKTGDWEQVALKEQKNFVSLAITEEAADLFSRTNQNGTVEAILESILRNDKRFIGTGEFANLKPLVLSSKTPPKVLKKWTDKGYKKGDTVSANEQKQDIAEVLFEHIAQKSTAQNTYGQQYSRTVDLDAKIFLDQDDVAIRVKDWKKAKDWKVGTKLDDGKIVSKVVDVYEPNYILSMDRYVERISSLIASTKLWGAKPIMKDQRFVGDWNKLFNKIQKEVNNSKISKYLDEEIKADFGYVLGASDYDHISTQGLRIAQSWAASIGLSNPRSAVKNLMLGQVQNIATYGFRRTFNTYFQYYLNWDKTARLSFRKEARALSREVAAEQSGILSTGFIVKLPAGKKMGSVQSVLTGKPASWLQDKMTWLMNNAEIHNRRVSVIMGDATSKDALKILRGETPSLYRNMNKAEARRILEDVLKVEDLDTAIKTGTFNNKQRARILTMSHATTQGLTEPVFMPRLMGHRYAKPFTLFYRIGYRITENVYKNVYRPIRETGNVSPMLKYLTFTAVTGSVLQAWQLKARSVDPKNFLAPWQKFIEALQSAEFMGLGMAIKGQGDSFLQLPGVAIKSTTLKLTGAMSMMASGLWSELVNEDGSYKEGIDPDIEVFKAGAKEFAEAIPFLNGVIKAIEGHITKKDLVDANDMRNAQRQYLKKVRPDPNQPKIEFIGKPSGRDYLLDIVEASIWAKDGSISNEDKLMYVWSAIHHMKDQKIAREIGRGITEKEALTYAIKYVEGFIRNNTRTITLSREITQGRGNSNYDDFYGKLKIDDPEKAERLKVLDKKWERNSNELIMMINNTKQYHYQRDLIPGI